MDMFDTVGTLVGVTQAAGWRHARDLPRTFRALISDAAGTVVSALLGTSTVTFESAAGILAGGWTGLTALAAAKLFLIAPLFSPLIRMVAGDPPITAPAMVIVGALMMNNARRVEWDDFTEGVPAFLAMVGIPLTFSIADGLAFALLSWRALKFLAGRGREIR